VVASTLQDFARKRSHGQASTSKLATPNGSAQAVAELHPAEGGPKRAGSVRLRDAIVWGYMMQRHDARTKVLQPRVSYQCNCFASIAGFAPQASSSATLWTDCNQDPVTMTLHCTPLAVLCLHFKTMLTHTFRLQSACRCILFPGRQKRIL
jgi:hypothetical protein